MASPPNSQLLYGPDPVINCGMCIRRSIPCVRVQVGKPCESCQRNHRSCKVGDNFYKTIDLQGNIHMTALRAKRRAEYVENERARARAQSLPALGRSPYVPGADDSPTPSPTSTPQPQLLNSHAPGPSASSSSSASALPSNLEHILCCDQCIPDKWAYPENTANVEEIAKLMNDYKGQTASRTFTVNDNQSLRGFDTIFYTVNQANFENRVFVNQRDRLRFFGIKQINSGEELWELFESHPGSLPRMVSSEQAEQTRDEVLIRKPNGVDTNCIQHGLKVHRGFFLEFVPARNGN